MSEGKQREGRNSLGEDRRTYDVDKLLNGDNAKYLAASEAAFAKERRSSKEVMMQAVEHGNLQKVRELVGAGAPIQKRNADGTYNLTALHTAAYHGHLGICRYLVKECGAVVDAADRAGLTPLHRAAYNGKRDVIAYLVEEARANLWATNSAGVTPCQMAQKFNQDAAAEQLLQYTLKRSPPVGFVQQSGSVEFNSATFKKAAELVGCRVQVFMKPKGAGFFSSKEWCEGTVVRYDEFKVKHQVRFDFGGDDKWIFFEFKAKPQQFRLLVLAPAPLAGAGAQAVAAPTAFPVATAVGEGEPYKPSAPVVQGVVVAQDEDGKQDVYKHGPS